MKRKQAQNFVQRRGGIEYYEIRNRGAAKRRKEHLI